jgi:hypothetical protein
MSERGPAQRSGAPFQIEPTRVLPRAAGALANQNSPDANRFTTNPYQAAPTASTCGAP